MKVNQDVVFLFAQSWLDVWEDNVNPEVTFGRYS